MIAAAKGTGGRGIRYSLMKRQWKETVWALAKSNRIPKAQPGDVAAVSFTWVERDRRRDLDNVASGQKLVLDGLVAAGALVDDGWRGVSALRHSFSVDAKRPGVMVVAEFGAPDT